MRAFAVILFIAALAACALPSRGGTDPVAAVIRNYAAERDFSGVILISDGVGAPVFGEARGAADHVTGAPVTMGTRFQIASISKLFVAAATLRQVDRGRVQLDAPIGLYVSNLPPRLAAISVAALLQHTSGLRRESAFQASEALTVAEHAARLTDNEIVSEPGTYSYSNTGYVLLARVVEVVTGEPFDRALEHDVLAPAHLADTGFIVGDDIVPRLAIGYARSRDGWSVPPRARHRGVYPPGGLYSTAGDLSRFMDALSEGRLLSEPSTRALFEPRVSTGEGAQMASFAGVISPRNGESYLLVAGSADGGKAVLMRALVARRTIVILSNVGDIPITEMLRDVVIASEGGSPTPPEPCRVYDPRNYAGRVGEYDFTGTGLDLMNGVTRYVVGIVLDDNRVFLWDAQDQGMTLLCEREPGVLTLSYSDAVRIRFEGSNPSTMVLDWDGRSYRADLLSR